MYIRIPQACIGLRVIFRPVLDYRLAYLWTKKTAKIGRFCGDGCFIGIAAL